MIIEETFVVQAPIDRVWTFMFDPKTMGPCVPGFVSATEVEADVFDVVTKVKVGIISLKMFSRIKIVEKNPPHHMKAAGDGHDKLRAGSFHQESEVDLKILSEEETEVRYSMNVRVVGKLATFGEKIMRMTANKMGGKIVENVKAQLEAPA
ncbi:MAG: CoxG family protein [Planctomycetota bacterium]|jgi:carbon monoxide dehydrogenase subunit G